MKLYPHKINVIAKWSHRRERWARIWERYTEHTVEEALDLAISIFEDEEEGEDDFNSISLFNGDDPSPMVELRSKEEVIKYKELRDWVQSAKD